MLYAAQYPHPQNVLAYEERKITKICLKVICMDYDGLLEGGISKEPFR